MGPQLGDVIRALHEEKGVHFHLENTVTGFEAGHFTLKNEPFRDTYFDFPVR